MLVDDGVFSARMMNRLGLLLVCFRLAIYRVYVEYDMRATYTADGFKMFV